MGCEEIKDTGVETWAVEVFKCKPSGVESPRIWAVLQEAMKKYEFETSHD